eukprot:2647420-Alexandrium_andersonii.AAC.1
MALYGVSTSRVPRRAAAMLQVASADVLLGKRDTLRAHGVAMSLAGYGLHDVGVMVALERIAVMRRVCRKRPYLRSVCEDMCAGYLQGEDLQPRGPVGLLFEALGDLGLFGDGAGGLSREGGPALR